MAQILWIYLYPCKLPGIVHHNWAVSISKPDMEISSFFDCSARPAVMWLGMARFWGSAPIARLRSSLGANSRPHYFEERFSNVAQERSIQERRTFQGIALYL